MAMRVFRRPELIFAKTSAVFDALGIVGFRIEETCTRNVRPRHRVSCLGKNKERRIAFELHVRLSHGSFQGFLHQEKRSLKVATSM